MPGPIFFRTLRMDSSQLKDKAIPNQFTTGRIEENPRSYAYEYGDWVQIWYVGSLDP